MLKKGEHPVDVTTVCVVYMYVGEWRLDCMRIDTLPRSSKRYIYLLKQYESLMRRPPSRRGLDGAVDHVITVMCVDQISGDVQSFRGSFGAAGCAAVQL